MADPKLNALVFCKKAVFTDPWMNLVGVFDEMLTRRGELEAFDVFVRLGDVPPDRDFEVRVQIVDPESGEVLGEEEALCRADKNGVASRTLEFQFTFPRDDVYEAHVWYDESYVDVQKLSVVLL